MGIRISKSLGYGFIDLRVDEDTGEMNDDRFNPDGWWHASYTERKTRWTVEGFKQHCRELTDDTDEFTDHFTLRLMLSDQFKDCHFRDLDSTIFHDEEYGLPNVAIFIPFTDEKWTRYDDIIDYYDAGQVAKPSVKLLDVPLYPYDGYINNETGEPVFDRMIREDIYMFRNAEGDRKYEIRSMALQLLGCELHWTEKYNVAIPEVLVEFFRYTKMFTDDKWIWKLQPMIYTYWT